MGIVPEWAIGVALAIAAITVARALSRMVRGPARGLPTSDKEAAELRQIVDALQNRVGELEERVDFTERLLAKNREGDRLGSPPR